MSTGVPIPLASTELRRHGGVIRSRSPLAVETPPERWSYAISLSLNRADYDSDRTNVPLKISADVLVDSGLLGCLVVANDWTTLLGTSSPSVGPGRHVVEVIWEQGDVAQLVFRNHGLNEKCVFVVGGVDVRPLTEGVPQHSPLLDALMDGDGRFLSIAKLRSAIERYEIAHTRPSASERPATT